MTAPSMTACFMVLSPSLWGPRPVAVRVARRFGSSFRSAGIADKSGDEHSAGAEVARGRIARSSTGPCIWPQSFRPYFTESQGEGSAQLGRYASVKKVTRLRVQRARSRRWREGEREKGWIALHLPPLDIYRLALSRM